MAVKKMKKNKKKRKDEDIRENVERWMVSYADFVTLLFCFFTAMYAISNVDTEKLGKFVDSMRNAFNVSAYGESSFSIIEGIQIVSPVNEEIENDIRKSLGSLIERSEGDINIRHDSRGVILSISDRMFFESGSSEIKEEAMEVLNDIGGYLSRIPNKILIEGHTDNVPIHTKRYPSNWELSSARAINVAKYLIKRYNIDPSRISATGYAEYKPIAPNDTPEGRAKNRRVDIVILNSSK